MTDPKKAGSTVPAQAPTTVKAKLDQYVNKTLEHLQTLMDTGNIVFPKDYSVENACKGAALALAELKNKDGKLALEVCTPSSIVNAIMGMCVDGLNVWKKQGYFIVYGEELHWQPKYTGHILLAKRDADVKEVNAQVIYGGDEFGFEVDLNTGRQKLLKHIIKFEDQKIDDIKGAYAVVVFNDGTSQLTVMSLAQIKKAWMMGFGGGDTKAHKGFTDEMAKKTVINRAVKILIESADDSEILDEDEDKPKATRERKTDAKGKQKQIDTVETTYEDVSNQPSGSSPETVKEQNAQMVEAKGPQNAGNDLPWEKPTQGAGGPLQDEEPTY